MIKKNKEKIIVVLVLMAFFLVPFLSRATNIHGVYTVNPINVTNTTATLVGYLNPSGLTTLGYFRYSTATPSPVFCNQIYGSNMKSTRESGPYYGGSSIKFSTIISGLSPNTAYYYCALASDSKNIEGGNVILFETPPIDSSSSTFSVRTKTPLTASATSSYLNGSYNASVATTTYFEYRKKVTPEAAWTTISVSSETHVKNSSGAISYLLTGLSSGDNYEFRTAIKDAGGTIKYGDVLVFNTLDANSSSDGNTCSASDKDDENNPNCYCSVYAHKSSPICVSGGGCSASDIDNPEIPSCYCTVHTCKNGGSCSPADKDDATNPACYCTAHNCDSGGHCSATDTEDVNNQACYCTTHNCNSGGQCSTSDKEDPNNQACYCSAHASCRNGGHCSVDDLANPEIPICYCTVHTCKNGWACSTTDLEDPGNPACYCTTHNCYGSSGNNGNGGNSCSNADDPNCNGTGTNIGFGQNGSNSRYNGNNNNYYGSGTGTGNNGSGSSGGNGTGNGNGNNGNGNNGGNGNGNNGNENNGGPLKIGQMATPPPDAVVHYHEGIETVLQRQIAANIPLAKMFGYEDGKDMQSFSWTLADYFAKIFGYVSPSGKEIRVSLPDVAAYELRLEGTKVVIYEYYYSIVVNIQSTTSTLRGTYGYEYYFNKPR